jgi:Tol biopolymer transport system component
MKGISFTICLLAVLAAGSFSQSGNFPVLQGPYLGQKQPGETPEIFAPGVISTVSHEFSCCFSPDGKEFYFTRNDPTLNQKVIMVTRLHEGVWTEPAVVPFVENQFSFEPMVTPDNKRLYFCSGKPIPGQPGPPMNMLYVERDGDGWGAAQNPGPPFNPAQTMFISVTAAGTMYATDISEGPGKECIGVVRKVDGQYQKLERLGPPINAGSQNMYPFVAPDESYLIFTSKKPSEKNSSVLSVSFKKPDGGWSEPQAIGVGMQAALPFVSHDGKYLFFTGGEQGASDIYWVSAKIFEKLKPKEQQ